jgi:hypothetical protein
MFYTSVFISVVNNSFSNVRKISLIEDHKILERVLVKLTGELEIIIL